jgi:hypothetical protein
VAVGHGAVVVDFGRFFGKKGDQLEVGITECGFHSDKRKIVFAREELEKKNLEHHLNYLFRRL